jgi:hypothetical protein
MVRVTTNMEMTTIEMNTGMNTEAITKSISMETATMKPCAAGMTITGTIFLRDSPRETNCLQDWKSNSFGAAHFHRVYKSAFNPAPRNSSAAWLRPLQNAPTSWSVDTSSS